MISTLLQYQMVSRDIGQSLKTVTSDPSVERETAYYLDNIDKIDSIDAFMKDDRIYRYAMKAMGLGDMTYAKAFMRKALEEGIDDRHSFANKLADTRYRNFVETFNFKRYGKTATVFGRAQEGVADAFARQTLEEKEGANNEGVRLALYFSRKASGIKNVYDILADRALAQTVYTALGLPKEFAMADIDHQAEYIKKHLDVDKLQDPKYLNRFLEKFSTLYDLENGNTQQPVPNLLISNGPAAIVGFGEGLLASIQNLKLGGS